MFPPDKLEDLHAYRIQDFEPIPALPQIPIQYNKNLKLHILDFESGGLCEQFSLEMANFLRMRVKQESRDSGALDPWGEAQKRIKYVKYLQPPEIQKAIAMRMIPAQAIPSGHQFKRKVESEIGDYLVKLPRGLADSGTDSGCESQPWMQ